MTKEVMSFDASQTVNDVTNMVKNTKFGSFPVLENGKCIGIIAREQILAPDNNGVILVDHNNPSQFAKGVNKDDIEGIVDHHIQQLVLDSTRVPISYMPVGATATLVAREFKANGIEIPPEIAGILWCAIISDTDKFTSVTTTPEDKKIASQLAKIANIEEQEVLANKLLAKRDACLENLTPSELIKSDLKILKTKTNKPYCIGQIKTYQSEKYIKNKEELEKALDLLDQEQNTQGSVLMVTDLSQSATYLLVSKKIREKLSPLNPIENEALFNKKVYKSPTSYKDVILALQNKKFTLRLPNVQSRKEQVQPLISDLIG